MNWRCLVGKTSFFIDFTRRYSQTHKEAHGMALVHLRLNDHFQIQVWLRVCVEGVVHMLLHNAQQHQNMNESDLYLVTSILEPLEILWTCWNSIYPQQSMSFSRHARCQEIKREERTRISRAPQFLCALTSEITNSTKSSSLVGWS